MRNIICVGSLWKFPNTHVHPAVQVLTLEMVRKAMLADYQHLAYQEIVVAVDTVLAPKCLSLCCHQQRDVVAVVVAAAVALAE